MSFSPEIIKTDTEIVIKFPKHSDLDIKFYNPEIIQSLGFVGATVHLDTLGPDAMFGGGLFDYEPVPEQPIEKLSYPYRYFAYMFRALNPNSNTYSTTQQPQSKGILGSIMETLGSKNKSPSETQKSGIIDSVFPSTESKTPEPKKSGFFSMFLAKKTKQTNDGIMNSITSNAAKSETIPDTVKEPVQESKGGIMDSLFGTNTPKEPVEESKGGIMDSLFGTNTPKEPVEESKGGIMDSLFGTNTPKEPVEESNGGVMDSLFSQTTAKDAEESKEPVEESKGGIMDSLFGTNTPKESVEESKQPVEESKGGIMDSLFGTNTPKESVEESKEPVEESKGDTEPEQTVNQNTPDPVLSVVPEMETDPKQPPPFAPITTQFSSKWVIHIPLASQIEKQPIEGVAERQNAEFEDVLMFSEMEVRNGIYIRGEFVNILGRHVKIGSVEQLEPGEKMRTVKEYLSGRILLEGTTLQKYYALIV